MQYISGKYIIILGFVTSFIINEIQCQNSHIIQGQYKFKNITVDQGLSHNNVRSICQDATGYIWIATPRGVDKFDGQTIISYKHNPQDSSTISSNDIRTIFLDSKNNLWIAGSGGLDIYNIDFDNFTRFIHQDINTIAEDRNEKLWIGTKTGLYTYDLNTLDIQYLSNKEDNPYGIPSTEIEKILVDKNNNLWFSVLFEGVILYNQDEGIFKHFKNNPEDNTTISGKRIFNLYEDKDGNIWAGSYDNGLNLYVPEDESFIRIIPDPDNNYSLRVRTIFEDLKGNLFIGTRAGLYVRNGFTNKFIHYAYEGHDFSSLSQNSILCSFIDSSGTLWIGTHSGGVNYTDLNKKNFIHYSAGQNNNYFLSGLNIFAITEDLKGNLWIGGDNGLNYLDRTTHTFKYYFSDPNDPYSLSHNDIKAFEWDKKGNLWIGTNMGGLNYYNVKTGKFISYKHDPNNPNSIPRDKLFGLIKDKDDNLWIITGIPNSSYFNVSILPNGSNKFILLNEKSRIGLDQDENGDVYIGGIGGFWIFSGQDSIYNFISNDTLIGLTNTIKKDSENKLWIGSDKGLVRYNKKNKSFIRFSEENGYPVDEVFGILEDDSKSLWVSTNSGLVKFTNIVEDINNVTFRVFNSEDGLQSKQFNYNAYYKCRSGEMMFGGINGFNTFFPDEIIENSIPPNVVLTDLKIFNKSVLIGEKVRGRIILQKSIMVTDEIVLGRKQNVFTIEFAALHYANPDKNMYKYKLEGFDEDWQLRKASNNFATYSNIPAGEYTFMLTAANSDGVWNEDGKTITVRILPPWWDTLWFKGIVLLVIIGSVFTVYRTRVNSLKRQHKILEQKVEERTIELRTQKDEILTQNEEIHQQSEELATQRDEIQKKNETLKNTYNKLKILNKFGQELTTMLNLEAINNMIYDYVSSLLDVSIFGIGVYNEKINSIIFTSLMEDGVPIPEFASPLNDPTSCAAWCYKNQKHIFCNRFKVEYKNFISELKIRSSKIPESLIYLPLTVKDKQIGILTLQSYNQNAYTENDLQTLQALASYIAIALDNASAYDIVKHQNIELEQHRTKLQKLVQDRTKDLEAAKLRAEEADKLKSAFLANMSHEIRTPLNAIIGFTNHLVNEDITKNFKDEILQIIEHNTFSLLHLINDIIDFSKIEAGLINITVSEVNLDILLRELQQTHIKEIKRLNREHEIELLVNLNAIKKPPILITDSIRLRQIFSNLINNAIKYTNKGFIEFGYKNIQDGYITFYVKDTGIGIEKKNLEIIFDRFRKIEEEKTKIYRGTGLGLSITKYLVELLGGKIWVESEPEKGSNFIFSLPLKTKKDSLVVHEKKEEEGEMPIPNWQNKTVLIVEDESSNFKVLKSMLKTTEIGILWAKDGEEAVALFKDHKNSIHIVLMDIKLPKKDGIVTARDIKKIKNAVPIIAQTAYALPEEEHNIRGGKFNDYIAKPITKNKLIKIMSQFLS